MSLQHKLDAMPAYIYNSARPGVRYFLTINRDIHGRYNASYMEYEDHSAIRVADDCETLEDALDALWEEGL